MNGSPLIYGVNRNFFRKKIIDKRKNSSAGDGTDDSYEKIKQRIDAEPSYIGELLNKNTNASEIKAECRDRHRIMLS